MLLKKIYLCSLIDSCHNYYGSSVLSFFWIPGLLSGGIFSFIFAIEVLQKKLGYRDFCCSAGCWFQTFLVILGTILGPIVFVPAGLFFLVKAAVDPSGEKSSDTPIYAKL